MCQLATVHMKRNVGTDEQNLKTFIEFLIFRIHLCLCD